VTSTRRSRSRASPPLPVLVEYICASWNNVDFSKRARSQFGMSQKRNERKRRRKKKEKKKKEKKKKEKKKEKKKRSQRLSKKIFAHSKNQPGRKFLSFSLSLSLSLSLPLSPSHPPTAPLTSGFPFSLRFTFSFLFFFSFFFFFFSGLSSNRPSLISHSFSEFLLLLPLVWPGGQGRFSLLSSVALLHNHPFFHAWPFPVRLQKKTKKQQKVVRSEPMKGSGCGV